MCRGDLEPNVRNRLKPTRAINSVDDLVHEPSRIIHIEKVSGTAGIAWRRRTAQI